MFIVIIIPETMMLGYVLWQVQMQDVIYQLSVLASNKAVGLKGEQRVACCHIVIAKVWKPPYAHQQETVK